MTCHVGVIVIYRIDHHQIALSYTQPRSQTRYMNLVFIDIHMSVSVRCNVYSYIMEFRGPSAEIPT
ncbi:hypothetical protein WN51_14021 [Melipona quadrifasciata]|uniref:Uncharacterized protein n=1 Tax=Melipona quadrifasciata TaxID=166423 RepID=A0A0M9A1F7_9HYME|nr:hypothetical protein WN51_14021 [Melipona quadrifasciata]